MNVLRRQYETSDDYRRLREFFRGLRASDPRSGANWHVCDFDYWRWHFMENVWERPLDELRYWEGSDGEVAGVLVQGEPGVLHPMADPKTRTEALLHDMVETAESEFIVELADGRRGLFFWVQEGDAPIQSVLEARGYEPPPEGRGTDYYGWQPLKDAPSEPRIPEGYTVRSMGDADELPSRSLASWRAFHPAEPDEGADPSGLWYRNVQRSPSYRRDLDVVAIDQQNGSIAAFSTAYFDDVTRTGVIVLVGTSTDHQCKGLGRAVVTEALRRLHWMGAVGARVTWTEHVPGLLYQSCGFADFEIGKAWRRFF